MSSLNRKVTQAIIDETLRVVRTQNERPTIITSDVIREATYDLRAIALHLIREGHGGAYCELLRELVANLPVVFSKMDDSPRDFAVLALRARGYTYQAIANHYNITRQRAFQIVDNQRQTLESELHAAEAAPANGLNADRSR